MRNWLVSRFLPMWAKQTVLEENKQLLQEIKQLRRQNRELRCYIRGMQKVCPRVIIKSGGEQ